MFVEELLTAYYEKKITAEYEFGDLYFTETYFPHENAEFFRPIAFQDNKTATHATRFQIQTSKPFQHSHPLADPPLRIGEEFIVVRAKVRPVVLLQPHIVIDDIDTTGYKSPLYRKQSLVAQVFSVQHSDTGQLKFPNTFLERIKELEYPHLFFLPKCDALPVDSILRLDACQSVFTNRLGTTGVALHTSANELLTSQFQSVITGEPCGYYQLFREEILRKKKEKHAATP